MKAYPVAWHQKCLANLEVSLKEKKKKRIALTKETLNLEWEIYFYNLQIVEASFVGKKSFSRDKYLQHQKPVRDDSI